MKIQRQTDQTGVEWNAQIVWVSLMHSQLIQVAGGGGQGSKIQMLGMLLTRLAVGLTG